MIVDTLQNIDTYRKLSADIYAGLVYIKEAAQTVPLGEYQIGDQVKAIVSEYYTIAHFERGYEAHEYVIDIQYPVIGTERVKWSPIAGMEINIPYDRERDRTFYLRPLSNDTHVDIGNGVFAIMFPQDAHSPQHFVCESEMIKKITVKVAI